jgi:hypothetical protein
VAHEGLAGNEKPRRPFLEIGGEDEDGARKALIRAEGIFQRPDAEVLENLPANVQHGIRLKAAKVTAEECRDGVPFRTKAQAAPITPDRLCGVPCECLDQRGALRMFRAQRLDG